MRQRSGISSCPLARRRAARALAAAAPAAEAHLRDILQAEA
jgi:hypothetical protein